MAKKVNDLFDEFVGGVNAPEVSILDAPHEQGTLHAAISVMTIDGQTIGTPRVREFWVRAEQLEFAPAQDMLYSQFEPAAPEQNGDPQLAHYRRIIENLGSAVQALQVLPMPKTIKVGDESFPMYQVYHDPYTFQALRQLQRALILIEIPEESNAGAILLKATSRHSTARKQSALEICDTALRLADTYGYDQKIIALHQAGDSESGEAPSQPLVSTRINVARLSEPVRLLLHRGAITFSHAKSLLLLRANEQQCILLAQLAVQDSLTVEQVRKWAAKLNPGVGMKPQAAISERAGRVVIEDLENLLHLVNERKRSDFIMTDTPMGAKPASIKREMARYHVSLIAHVDPNKIAVAAGSTAPLQAWLASHQTQDIPVVELEAALLGLREAIRAKAKEVGALSAEGNLVSMSEEELPNAKQA